ncbi:MAG: hypothetical protein NTV34_03070, partial [Proteobacteria bacterium]|nr:hypothetical protein [Pseudomonadota bacterium]
PKALSRCIPLPSGKAKVKLNSITSLGKTSCGVEIEVIDALKQTWFSKGSRADFWSEDSNICNAKIGGKMTLLLVKECCDANYDWCEAEWMIGQTKKRADGNRIYSSSKNRTF